jgi:methionyl-tRNA formyltransferase
MSGDRVTGVTIFIMDEGVDTGPILLSERFEFGEETTKGDLTYELAHLGAGLFLRAATLLMTGELEPMPQPEEGACYAEKIRKEELWLDWDRPAIEIARMINALSPRPGARTFLDGAMAKLLRARTQGEVDAPPGEVRVRGNKLLIGSGSCAVEILEIQPEGGKPMAASAYLAGHAPMRAKGREQPS